jgi:hypothetical protein
MAVPTSLLADERSPEIDRRVRIAIVLALFLHVPLFVPGGGFNFGTSLQPASEPSLTVRLDPLPAPEPKQEVQTASTVLPVAPPQPVEPTPARQPGGGKEIRASEGVTSGTPEGVTILEDEQFAYADPQEEGPDVPSENESPAQIDSAFATAEGAEKPRDELAPDVELAEEAVPETAAVVASVAPAQERVLTGRLEREARALLESSAPQRELTFRQRDREYTAKLKREPSPDGTGIERVFVEVTTEHDGERVQTRLSMRRLAFSHFTQLVDYWDPMVQLHDDEIAGRFHSNNEINLTYDRKVAPRLLGKVTTARRVKILNEEGYRRQGDIFAGGLETRTPRIRLPEISLPVAEERSTRNADVDVVRGDSLIIFYADGSYTTMDLASKAQQKRQLTAGRATYIVGTRDAELHVRGIVNGSVTVYSPKRIVVRGNLTYDHVLRGGKKDDYLGLVSDGNVEVDSPQVTGPGNLEICAAVYARNRFVVRATASRGGATLIIRGSLTAGSLSHTEPRYATRLEFDPRFEQVRPPGFPETDRYEIEKWDGRWRAAAPVTGGG